MKKARIPVLFEDIQIDQLNEDPKNPNHMDPAQLEALTNAMKRYGVVLQPILARLNDDGEYTIIDGHHRVKAARAAGFKAVPTVVVQTDEDLARIMQIGMNRIRGELDLGEVAQAAATLLSHGVSIEDVKLTGFTEEEIVALTRAVQPEDVAISDEPIDAKREPRAEEPGVRPVLELSFDSIDDMQRAKRGLKRAAGKGNELSQGLLVLLDGAGDG